MNQNRIYARNCIIKEITTKDPKSKTEKELRWNEGWRRIYDCGNLKFVYTKKA